MTRTAPIRHICPPIHLRFGLSFIIGLLAWVFSIALAQADVSPERVVVVANSADPVSEQIARYYMEQRGIPEKNLIELETTTEEQISWDDFIATIYNPLRRQLVEQDWLSGTLSSQTDSEGRIQAALASNNIDFLVLCRLPTGIRRDSARLARAENPPSKREFRVNSGTVDSELSLLMQNDTPTIGFVSNPLFGKFNLPKINEEAIVKVARLDGPGFEAVKRSIDSALEGERLGLRGRGYIDMGGPPRRR